MNIQSTTRRPNTQVSTPAPDQQNRQPTDPLPSPKEPTDLLSTGAEIFKDGGIFLLNEAREVGRNDPALGLRLAANRFDSEFLDGTGNVADGFSNMAVAFVRGGLLGANVYRATSTFQDPNAQLYQKALDVGRIATDLVGLAGAVMQLAVPSMADTARVMVQFAYGADLVSHSVRTLEHAGTRIAALKEARAREKSQQQESQPKSS
ncbi:MAG: hypothetical protein WC314_02635 [Vulcanimicrobiota bacterium]